MFQKGLWIPKFDFELLHLNGVFIYIFTYFRDLFLQFRHDQLDVFYFLIAFIFYLLH
ncbi:hypothetical protein N483_06995 [Pseudoalteromonas luteoviolacea NCIMB 1944]|nr:hypothetical protein N483_06995 [Pseudoalteromonas luteoviolacea NCIMB 1944]